jgi:serine/threonine-protein kinase
MPTPPEQAAGDRNLLFGVLALQADLIDQAQFAEACAAWATRKDTPLADLLAARGWLTPQDRADVERLLARKLQRHQGDAHACLIETTSLDARRMLAVLKDPSLTASLGPELDDGDLTPAVGPPVARDRYALVRLHATGGIGRVWVAHDDSLRRDVALKELRPERGRDADLEARFLAEAQVTGQLEHPGIVPVYELARRPDGQPLFYTMRFVRGRTFAEAIRAYHTRRAAAQAGPLELRELLTAFVTACNALAYAHSRGVIHRDLKSANVVLGDFGEVMVLDWGLAKVTGSPEGAGPQTPPALPPSGQLDLTLHGQVIGTPAYMAPEQAEGRSDLFDGRTDIYGLGAILFEILTGRPPHLGKSALDVLRRIVGEPTPRARDALPSVPRPLDAICARAMAKAPAERYPSARALVEDVQRWLADEPVSVWREPLATRARRWLARRRALVGAAAAAVLVALVSVTAAAVILNQARQRESEARALAEHNYQLARAAVDRYHTEVSESVLLHEPGLEPLRRRLLEAAREFYDRFAREHSQDPEARGELGKALFRLAQVTGELDAPAAALALHAQAATLFEQLAAEHPEVAEYQSDLAGCYHHMGRLSRLADRLDQAEGYYRKALAGWERLEHDHPGEAEYRCGLARSRLGLGNHCWVARRLDEARRHYEQAEATWQALLRQRPRQAEYRRDLAVVRHNLARVLADLGQRDRAEATYKEALAIQEALVREQPRISQYQNDLARTYFNVGELHARTDQPGRAAPAWRQAEARWKALTRDHPAVPDFQVSLAEVYSRLAGLYRSAGKTKEAEQACEECLALRRTLAADSKSAAHLRADLARGLAELGGVYRAARQVAKAETAYLEAVGLLAKVAAEEPAVPFYRRELARAYSELGLLRLERGPTAAAAEVLGKALVLWQGLARAHPDDPDHALGLGVCCNNLGNRARQAGEPAAALDWYGQALQALGAGAAIGRAAARKALRDAHWGRAEALTRLGRSVEAVADWDQAVELADSRDRPWFRLYRTVGLARAGEHARADAEARQLAGVAARSGEALYRLAAAYALASAAAAGDAKLSAGARRDAAERYAHRGIELLERAAATGYFRTVANHDRLATDPDLERLRSRAEFRKLLQTTATAGKG